jgi:hypothetical protein
MVPSTGESPPTGQVAATNRSLFSQNLREGKQQELKRIRRILWTRMVMPQWRLRVR